jgi:hypothetical protein
MVVKSSTQKTTSKQGNPKQGNIYDAFAKQMLGRIFVFVDFLVHYADKKFIKEINLKKITLAPTHYFGKGGKERIVDLVFRCPLKNGGGSLMAVIVFEHQGGSLKKIPQKLLKYISAIWDTEMKEGKPLSAPYFIILRTGKKPHRGTLPTMAALLPKGSDGKPLGHVPEFRYDVVDLPAWDFSKLVGGTVLRLALGLLHKMTGGHPDEFPEALLPLLEITDEEKQIELTKELMDFVNRAFAAQNQRLDEETWNKALNPIFKGKERTMIKTIFEEKVDEGEARASREIILESLRGKFGRVPKNIERAVNQMSDPVALKSLAVRTGNCKTLDEFAAEL